MRDQVQRFKRLWLPVVNSLIAAVVLFGSGEASGAPDAGGSVAVLPVTNI